ncbi:MAG: S41 family peptidase [Defluviitaleaceae bacterium]|nr:S41 family peptidase [Defluviitaleaceae bacterium]
MSISYLEDAQLLVKWVEAMHPIFYFNEIPSEYDGKRDAYLKAVSHPMAKWHFIFETMKYLTAMHDGHMGSGYSLFGPDSSMIDTEIIYTKNRLFVSNNGKPGDEIIAIGGVPATKILETVKMLTFAENIHAQKRQYERMCRFVQILEYAGCATTNPISITLQGTDEYTQESAIIAQNQLPSAKIKNDYIIRHEVRNDIFIIDLREFTPHQCIDDTCEEIKKAIKNGIKKFIVDVRGNSGGNSNVGEALLSAMGMKAPQYGMYEVVSDYVIGRWGGEKPENGTRYHAPNPGCAVINENIQLVVLNDHDTFSSATMFSVWVQDGKLGTIIGSPSINSPNSYGEMMWFMLPLSGQGFPISRKKFLRPDTNADANVLWPDVLLESHEDAMEQALEFLSDNHIQPV